MLSVASAVFRGTALLSTFTLAQHLPVAAPDFFMSLQAFTTVRVPLMVVVQALPFEAPTQMTGGPPAAEQWTQKAVVPAQTACGNRQVSQGLTQGCCHV